jgi:hypothetical protein
MIEKSASWSEIEKSIDIIVSNIKKDNKKYNYIVSLNRGGLIPGVLLSHKLNIPNCVYTIQSYSDKEKKKLKKDLYISMIGSFKSSDHILVVDDISDTGETLAETIKKIKKIDSDVKNIDVATIYYKNKSIFKPTYYAAEIDNDIWINFAWENNVRKS